MFAGLLANWLLPWLRFTSRPLSLVPLLVFFDFLFLILWIAALMRSGNELIKISFPPFNHLDAIFFAVPALFTPLSVLGAIMLNNGGPNFLTMIMLGGIAVYVFFVFIFRARLNENVFPWAILSITLPLLLMWWLRSWYVSGIDINREFHIFQIIKDHGYWSMSLFPDPYNACLSVSILPVIASLIFKLVITLIYSVTPLVVYLFVKKHASKIISFIAAFFFASQTTFVSAGSSIPVRQEIALFFFALMMLVLYVIDLVQWQKKILILIFGFSMIVSHYTTTYIALSLFAFTYLIVLFFRKTKIGGFCREISGKCVSNGKVDKTNPSDYRLGAIIVFPLLVFAFIWYAQMTNISGNLVAFVSDSLTNMSKIFTQDVRAERTSPLDQLNIFYTPRDSAVMLQNYVKEAIPWYAKDPYISLYPGKETDFKPMVALSETLRIVINRVVVSATHVFGEFLKILVKIFVIIGICNIVFFRSGNAKNDFEHKILVLMSFFWLVAVMILPFASITYDLGRTYQQVLVILALPAVTGALLAFNFLKKDRTIMSAQIIFISFFLVTSGFLPQIAGGDAANMWLNNFGAEYDALYVHSQENDSASWLSDNYVSSGAIPIYADKRAEDKLLLSDKINAGVFLNDVFPQTIAKDAYVYLSYSNAVQKKGYIDTAGQIISYNFPNEFLSDNKNEIYNNGGSEIFK